MKAPHVGDRALERRYVLGTQRATCGFELRTSDGQFGEFDAIELLGETPQGPITSDAHPRDDLIGSSCRIDPGGEQRPRQGGNPPRSVETIPVENAH